MEGPLHRNITVEKFHLTAPFPVTEHKVANDRSKLQRKRTASIFGGLARF
jgi:hypothetical protein